MRQGPHRPSRSADPVTASRESFHGRPDDDWTPTAVRAVETFAEHYADDDRPLSRDAVAAFRESYRGEP